MRAKRWCGQPAAVQPAAPVVEPGGGSHHPPRGRCMHTKKPERSLRLSREIMAVRGGLTRADALALRAACGCPTGCAGCRTRRGFSLPPSWVLYAYKKA